MVLQSVQWPGRLQQLVDAPRCPDGAELWVDGGHNPAAGQSLAQQLAAWEGETHIIVGMLNTKEASSYLGPLLDQATSVQTVAIPQQEASLTAEELAGQAGEAAVARASVQEALEQIPSSATRVLICGSLYLVGWVMAEQGIALD